MPSERFDACEPARVPGHERTAQPRAAAGVEDVELFRGLEASLGQRRRHERGRAVGQPLELGLEARREAVECPLDERVRGARRHLTARARRPHVAGDRIAGLVLEPLFEDLHRFLGLAKRAVREREQPPRVPVLRPQRDDLREARRRFARALQPVEQDAEVRVRVDVAGIDRDRRAVLRFGAGRIAGGPQQHAEVVVGVRVARLEGDRAPVRLDRLIEPAGRLKDDAEVAVAVRAIRHDEEAALDELDRLVMPSLLMGEDAGEVERVGMPRVRLEHAAIHLVRCVELVALLQRDRERDGLVDRELARLVRLATRPCCRRCRT